MASCSHLVIDEEKLGQDWPPRPADHRLDVFRRELDAPRGTIPIARLTAHSEAASFGLRVHSWETLEKALYDRARALGGDAVINEQAKQSGEDASARRTKTILVLRYPFR